MKMFVALIALVLASLTLTPVANAAGPFQGEHFTKEFYFCGTTLGTGKHTGTDPANCMPFADQNIWAIPAGTVIEKVYAVITTLITGTSDLDIGDTDQSDDYIDGSVSLTLGTVGMYGWDAKSAGAYLRVQTAGATDAGDIYVVPAAKYYAAAGKNLTMDITTANTAGKMIVVVEGFRPKTFP